jgi:signal recognition particle receptor subunit beta
MTKVLVHELARHTAPLLEQLRAVLTRHQGAEIEQLLARAVTSPHARPRMVLVGQFSSGKSTLIKALTDGAVDPKIDADIATDEVTEYPWDGAVILVDTPGVESGLREHDDLAWEAIGNSDFILFVITVNLFDDASARFIRELAHRRQKFDQMIVVVTQTSRMSAPEGVRRDAVRQALGTFNYTPPVHEVDSVYYLRSLEDTSRADALRAESRIDDLRAEINRISDERGELARLRQPLQLIRQLCDEALSLLVEEPRQRVAIAVLAAQRKAVTERRGHIDVQFQAAESRFKSRCLQAVVGFADVVLSEDSAPSDADLERRWNDLRTALDRSASQLADEVNVLAAYQFDTLLAQLIEIDGSNRVAELDRYAGDITVESVADAPIRRPTGSSRDASSTDTDWLRAVGAWLEQGRSMWGAGDGVKAASGTFGHQAVKEIGHRFGAKFKPWQAVRIANNIGRVATGAGIAVQVVTTVSDVMAAHAAQVRAQHQADRRRSAFITELMGMADDISASARRGLSEIIDPPFRSLLDRIDQLRNDILAADDARSRSTAEIERIAREADRLLALPAGPVGAPPGDDDEVGHLAPTQ